MTDLANQAAVFSFIEVKEETEELPYNTQKQILAKGFQSNKIFENGELLDTLEKRGKSYLFRMSLAIVHRPLHLVFYIFKLLLKILLGLNCLEYSVTVLAQNFYKGGY